MKSINFLRLLNQLYGRAPLDLDFIQRQGLLAVKIGQLHALRVDFLSAEKCNKLTKLYEHTEAIPAEEARQLITDYAGADYLKNFAKFSDQPLASASIGQVHSAKLLSGESVVIKVVKKKFTAGFNHDVKIARRLLSFAMLFQPRLKGVANPLGLLETLEIMTTEELNLLNEIKGQQILEKIRQKESRRFDLSDLASVKIYPELSSENILVSEHLKGATLATLIDKKKFSYEDLLRLFRLHGFFLFCVGTFHGDIHPGNIFFDGQQFRWVDAGHLGVVSKKLSNGLFNFFDHLSQDDFSGAAQWLNKMADKPLVGNTYQRFEKEFLKIYAEFGGRTVSEISLTKQMMYTIKTGVLYGMDFGEEIFDVIKSLMYMDGMVLKVNPRAVLLKDMRQFINDFKPFV